MNSGFTLNLLTVVCEYSSVLNLLMSLSYWKSSQK
jgi:hypothetical protein